MILLQDKTNFFEKHVSDTLKAGINHLAMPDVTAHLLVSTLYVSLLLVLIDLAGLTESAY
jgi:hypothetical protein